MPLRHLFAHPRGDQTGGVRQGIVSHTATGRTFRYGELAEAAARLPIPRDVPLKKPEEWRLLGKPLPMIDTPAKVTGQPIYATDVRLPGMLYAAVKGCPAHGGTLMSFEADPVLAMDGVRHVVPVGRTAVAVVATGWWQAKKALDALSVVWDDAASADLSTEAEGAVPAGSGSPASDRRLSPG